MMTPDQTLRQMARHEDMRPVHALLSAAFAYMDAVIDPPSSLARLSPADLADQAARSELWVVEHRAAPLACMLLTPRADTLYLGKLAVADTCRRIGLARTLIDHACRRARDHGLPTVTLQTRVELTANHATFRKLGFVETARSAHPGFDRPTSITFVRLV